MNKYLLNTLLCLGTALFTLPSLCHADDNSRNLEIAQRFAQCDINHDGRLTKEEARGCMPRIYEHFSYLDSGNKGYVTVAEIQAAAN